MTVKDLRQSHKEETGTYPAGSDSFGNIYLIEHGARMDLINYINWLENKIIEQNEPT